MGDIINLMKTVKISDLKAHLSEHLRRVRRGEEVLVCDRDQPIARIVPCNAESFSEQERRLIARGVMSPPLKPRPANSSWPMPTGKVSDEAMKRVLREDRDDR